jgi:hypothetical protein
MPQKANFTNQLQSANPLASLPHIRNNLDDVINSIIVCTGMTVPDKEFAHSLAQAG